jgi:hypothetical protein
MKRKILIVLLGLGTVVGYGSGVRSMRCHARQRQTQFEEHVAKVCADAALGQRDGRDERDDGPGRHHGRP